MNQTKQCYYLKEMVSVPIYLNQKKSLLYLWFFAFSEIEFFFITFYNNCLIHLLMQIILQKYMHIYDK